MVKGLSWLTVDNTPIMVIDYSNCTEREMFALLEESGQLILDAPEPVLVLAVFNDHTFISHAYRQAADKMAKRVIPRIRKMAFTGMNDAKSTILSDFSSTVNRNYQAFKTREQAIAFLMDGRTTNQL